MNVIATQPAGAGDDGQAAAVFKFSVCEPCGAFLPPDATSCPTCSVELAAFVSQLPTIHFDYSGGAR